MKVNKMSRARYNSRKKNKSRMKYKKRTKSKTKTKIMNKMKGGAANVAQPVSRLPSGMSFRLPTNNEIKKLKELEDKKRKIEAELDSLNFKMRLKNLELFEVTSSFVQLRYFYEKGKIPLYFTINTSDLSVDILQYFLNNNKLRITDDNYISIDENTINLKGYKTAGQKRTGGGHEDTNKFIDIYEDETTDMISYEDSLKNLGYGKVKHDVGHIFEIKLKNLQNNLDYKLVEDVSWLKEITNDLNDLNDLNVSQLKNNNSDSDSDKKQKKIEYFLEQIKL